MTALLADSGITSLLGSASAGLAEAGQFAFAQDFLAQTAMISPRAQHWPPVPWWSRRRPAGTRRPPRPPSCCH